MYHYTDSGLGNVYLVNGYTEHETPYGRAVSIENIEELHDAIGRGIIAAPSPLTGAELRFLRHELDMSQKRLGQLFGVNEQTVARWEKRRGAIDAVADRLIRLVYGEYKKGPGPVLDLVNWLAEADQMIESANIKLKKTSTSWEVVDGQRAA